MKENQEGEPVFDTEKLTKQLELANMEVVDEEVVTPEEGVEVTVEDDKIPSMKNVPYVKIEDEDGNVLNPINGSYPNFFKSRRERKVAIREAIKNPKNNKKGTRLVVTKLGALSFTKANVVKQTIEASREPILGDDTELVGWKYNKSRTLVHNQIKNN
tara:strand:+ start:15938 stop:16411 length:474 start_codon:yes stop_codon:yes gene_type:complete